MKKNAYFPENLPAELSTILTSNNKSYSDEGILIEESPLIPDWKIILCEFENGNSQVIKIKLISDEGGKLNLIADIKNFSYEPGHHYKLNSKYSPIANYISVLIEETVNSTPTDFIGDIML